MKSVTDSTLRIIDHASSKLGPISSLLEKLLKRVVPTATASACIGVILHIRLWQEAQLLQ